MTIKSIRMFGRDFWIAFSDVFRYVVRAIETVLPTEVAWAIIWWFLCVGFACLMLWVATP